tara:strand:- start:2226 stop:4094 length:1869 start_codon:yes stop_codon:yes gene_type:complete
MATATSNKLEVSALDFDDIKNNLKIFLQSQKEFQDYDFEGSGMAVLLDTLAYNTHYLAFNTNMAVNEIFLESADVRKNVVALAKALGYTPTSAKAPFAELDVTINNVPAGTATVTATKGTTFNTSVDGNTFTFLTNEDVTITPVSGVYKFSNLKVFEGTSVSFTYTVDSTDEDQRFIIPSNNADTATLKVTVQNSSSDTTTETYSLVTGLTSLSDTSKVYFLQETEDGRFEVYFGDGILGKALSDGNIVTLEYIVTNKNLSNGASSFTLSGNIGGFSDVLVSTSSNAQGGSEAQSNNSIRFNAPLQYTAQDRAVTVKDYESLVQTIFPNALSVSAYGGEDAETPEYGKVFISIKAASGSTLTTATKNDIVNQLKKFNVASVTPVIVDPETTSIILTTTAKYDELATIKSTDTLKSDITTALSNFNTANLQKFDGIFRYSKVIKTIDDVDPSILSNITTVKMRKNFTPTLGSATTYNIFFRNAFFNPHSGHDASAGGILSSTGFKITGNTNEMFLNDDGEGNVRMFYLSGTTKVYHNNTQGTINYTNGTVTLTSLNVASISNIRGSSSSVIELTTTPNSNDVVPVRDQIIEIDVANSTVSVEADTFAGGTADAGTTYTTTSSY